MYILLFLVFYIFNIIGNINEKILKIKDINTLNKTIENSEYFILYAYDKKLIKKNIKNKSKEKHISLIKALKKITKIKNIISKKESIKIGIIDINKIKNFNNIYNMQNESVLFFFYKGKYINQASLLEQTNLNKLKQLLYIIYENNMLTKKRWNKKIKKNIIKSKNNNSCLIKNKSNENKKIKTNSKNNAKASFLLIAPSYNYEYGGNLWGPWISSPGWAPYTGFGSWSYAPVNPEYGSTITFPL